MKPLALFLKPPFTGWSLVHGFGIPSTPGPVHLDVLYQRSGPAQVRAAGSGDLSIVRGGGYRIMQPMPFDSAIPGGNGPEVVDLFLELDAADGLNAVYWTKLVLEGIITGFVYRNILVSSLEGALAELLDEATLPALPTRSAAIDALLGGLIKVSIPVGHAVGEPGPAEPPQIALDARAFGFAVFNADGPVDPADFYDSMREFVDDGQTEVDSFITLTPKYWPLIGAQTPFNLALAQAATMLIPYSALTVYREQAGLTYAQMRQLGDAQKELYRQQLNYRYATRLANSPEPPFTFNDLDATNLFQLEAIAEFFINFTDPLQPGAIPRQPSLGTLSGTGATAAGHWVTLPGIASSDFVSIVKNEHFLYLPGSTVKTSRTFRIIDLDPTNSAVFVHRAPTLTGPSDWSIQLYKTVDFLDPGGIVSAVSGSTLTLAGAPDLREVWPDEDIIRLTWPGGGLQQLKITDVDPVAGTVTTDQPPSASATDWSILMTPKLVLIDPFGSRPVLRSRRSNLLRAQVRAGQANQVTLGDASTGYPVLAKINGGYDTVYFEADQARPGKTYRILSIQSQTINNAPVENVLELDAQPDFGTGGTSHYAIQAGVSGDMEEIANLNLGPDGHHNHPGSYGWDHYDGALFVIHGDTVSPPWRWTSYTSREHLMPLEQVQYRSSVRGNKEYDYYSQRSPTKAFINFGFNVVDRFECDKPNYTGVGEARFYHERLADGTVHRDDIAPGDLPATPGKTACLFHRGNIASNAGSPGTGSAGCFVSPLYYHLLHTLIQFEIERREATGQTVHATLETLLTASLSRAEPQNNYHLTTGWTREIFGRFWLIRPEELPPGPNL